MSFNKNLSHKQKIKYRIRKKIAGTPQRPRLVVFRSLNNIYATLIDDQNNKTLLGVSTLNKEVKEIIKDSKTKIFKSKVVGQILGKKALEKNIKKIVFDRNGYLFHGRVRAVADGARESGLEF
jgi:large subunit ribosomal protein L18